jgi:hypothetical protein
MSSIDIRREIAEHADIMGPPDASGAAAKIGAIPPWIPDILQSCGDPGLPALQALDLVPWMGEDGTIHTQPGYNPDTRRMLALPPGLVIPPVPDRPTPAQVSDALGTLWDLLGEFHFDGPGSRANALAWCLTGLLRPMIDGPCPMNICTGSTPGLGKGLFQDLAAIMASGAPATKTTSPRSAEELGKRVETYLKGGAHTVILDDMTATVDCPHLHAVLTAWPFYTFRKLGVSETLDVQTRTLWAMNGNNLAIRTDLGRRVLPVRLLPAPGYESCPHMAIRTRTQDELLQEAQERRGLLLAAALTLARNWHNAGRPGPEQGNRSGSFPAWDQTIGGILRESGVPGLLSNRAEEMSRMAEGDGVSIFLDCLATVAQERHWRPMALVLAITGAGGDTGKGWILTAAEAGELQEPLVNALPANVLGQGPEAKARALGLAIAHRLDHTSREGWKLVEVKRSGGARVYQLARIAPSLPEIDPTL